MQTIKCVVVGDGAVGKVGVHGPYVLLHSTAALDLLVDLIYYQQVPERIRSDCMPSLYPRVPFLQVSLRSLITMQSLS
jgi:hypothetical protein